MEDIVDDRFEYTHVLALFLVVKMVSLTLVGGNDSAQLLGMHILTGDCDLFCASPHPMQRISRSDFATKILARY